MKTMKKLNEFIRDALTEVMDGVTQAQQQTSKSGAVLNALPSSLGDVQKQGRMVFMNERLIEEIEFDIAVTVGEDGNSKAGISLFAGVFGGSIQTDIGNSSQAVNRVKFKIPICYPKQPGT